MVSPRKNHSRQHDYGKNSHLRPLVARLSTSPFFSLPIEMLVFCKRYLVPTHSCKYSFFLWYRQFLDKNIRTLFARIDGTFQSILLIVPISSGELIRRTVKYLATIIYSSLFVVFFHFQIFRKAFSYENRKLPKIRRRNVFVAFVLYYFTIEFVSQSFSLILITETSRLSFFLMIC